MTSSGTRASPGPHRSGARELFTIRLLQLELEVLDVRERTSSRLPARRPPSWKYTSLSASAAISWSCRSVTPTSAATTTVSPTTPPFLPPPDLPKPGWPHPSNPHPEPPRGPVRLRRHWYTVSTLGNLDERGLTVLDVDDADVGRHLRYDPADVRAWVESLRDTSWLGRSAPRLQRSFSFRTSLVRHEMAAVARVSVRCWPRFRGGGGCRRCGPFWKRGGRPQSCGWRNSRLNWSGGRRTCGGGESPQTPGDRPRAVSGGAGRGGSTRRGGRRIKEAGRAATRGASQGERGRGRGPVGGLPGDHGRRDGGRSRRARRPAGCGGTGLGQRLRLPRRGRESTSEAAGGARLADRGETGQVHAARAGTAR